MAKFVTFTILGGLVLLAVITMSIREVDAKAETKFIPISVLAEDKADYGVDENVPSIPAISSEIIEDKIHDIRSRSSVPVITYTSLPVESSASDQQDKNNQTQSENGDEGNNNHGSNGQGNPNQGHEPGANNGNGANNNETNQNTNNGQDKGKGQENKPGNKGSGPEDKPEKDK